MRFEQYKTYLQYELNRSAHTVRSYISDLSAFAAFVEQEGMSSASFPAGECEGDRIWGTDLDSRSVRLWLSGMSRQGQSAASLKRRASAVSGYFRYLQRIGAVSRNPVDNMPLAKVPPRLPRFIQPDRMEQIMASNNALVEDSKDADASVRHTVLRDALVIELLYATGMRRSELLGLADRDFNPLRAELLLHGKGGKDRVVPLAQELVKKIERYISVRNEVFANTVPHLLRGNRGGALNQTLLSAIVKEQLVSAHAERPTPHLLRHSFATSMLSGGADINVVKEMLGHSGLDATQIYTHVSLPQLKAEYIKAHPRAKNKEH